MTKADLITGFLGAGKTSFLLRYARYMLEHGEKIAILVFDRGAVNVDMPLLGELRGENCEIEMLAGACDPDCHRRRFRTKLISLGLQGFDRVLIEPSGVFDMDEYFDVLQESPLDRWFEPGSVIAIVDALLEEDSTPEEDYYLASQAASAGCVVLSRTQLADETRIQSTLRHLDRACDSIRARRVTGRVIAKNWESLSDADYQRLENCGWYAADYSKTIAGQRSTFQSLSFLNLGLNRAELEQRAARLFSDDGFGKILRVKGFFEEEGRWYQFNATKTGLCIEPVPENRGAIIVIGSGLNEDAVSLLMTGRLPELHIL